MAEGTSSAGTCNVGYTIACPCLVLGWYSHPELSALTQAIPYSSSTVQGAMARKIDEATVKILLRLFQSPEKILAKPDFVVFVIFWTRRFCSDHQFWLEYLSSTTTPKKIFFEKWEESSLKKNKHRQKKEPKKMKGLLLVVANIRIIDYRPLALKKNRLHPDIPFTKPRQIEKHY